ncbi:MAG: glycosyltransferase [Candidatus Micrarchaeota archaeon]|nr:glycosyltransferase [Candidatus Micrarchaeota archaeon]MDE1847562.1 glycosyltransferase [Candidatus Micrarchaeota archaeon]MDE1864279.1 glycosyltransferase [Candidatus Micrarchaeota archaeon]
MEGLTTLIFSKDDIPQTLGLIKSVYKISDEIVLIDSSSTKNRKTLQKYIKKLDKVRYFYTIALGYPDPMRMYALKKCRFNWVLLIDTDERLSASLHGEIRALIEKAGCDAYAIKRYEGFDGTHRGNFTWQTRLFKKDRVSFTGMLHEQAAVNGRLLRLVKGDYYLEHHASMLHTASSVYEELYKFDRLTYGTYNKKMLEYLSKMVVPEAPIEKTLAGKLFFNTLLAYEILCGKEHEHELTRFDYNNLYLIRNIIYGIKQEGIAGIPKAFKITSKELAEFYGHMSDKDSKQTLAISTQLNKLGLIKYLGLEKESTIVRLNSKYKNSRQGIPLLVRLLKQKHANPRK